jgi:hypothetical protein
MLMYNTEPLVSLLEQSGVFHKVLCPVQPGDFDKHGMLQGIKPPGPELVGRGHHFRRDFFPLGNPHHLTCPIGPARNLEGLPWVYPDHDGPYSQSADSDYYVLSQCKAG